MNASCDIFGDLISTYTRAQGIADGVLVDLTDTAREAGIRHPVAITRAAFEDSVAWTRGGGWQDEAGRAWDVVYMLANAIRRSNGGRVVEFTVYRVPNVGRGRSPRPVRLVAVCGPGDNAEPVVTVMLPGED